MPENTHTAEDAARALRTDLAHIAKSLLAHLSDGRFVLCILRGDQRLDRKKLCRAAGAKHMSLAKADDVLRVTGYPVGAVPPFPLKSEVPAYMDPQVLEVDMVYCGGGDVDALVEVPTEELARVTRAEAVDLSLT
jgi:Cys-tRNA(Pro) deacylase